MPWYTRFDYVKIEKYNHLTGGFDFYWQDNFDTFDDERWLRADYHSFSVNDITDTTYYANQIYTEDGALVIKMDNVQESIALAAKQAAEFETDSRYSA